MLIPEPGLVHLFEALRLQWCLFVLALRPRLQRLTPGPNPAHLFEAPRLQWSARVPSLRLQRLIRRPNLVQQSAALLLSQYTAPPQYHKSELLHRAPRVTSLQALARLALPQ